MHQLQVIILNCSKKCSSCDIITHFTGLLQTKNNDKLPVGMLAQLVEHCITVWYHRELGFKSHTGLNFFQALFSLLLKQCSLLQRPLSYSFLKRSSQTLFSYIYNHLSILGYCFLCSFNEDEALSGSLLVDEGILHQVLHLVWLF